MTWPSRSNRGDWLSSVGKSILRACAPRTLGPKPASFAFDGLPVHEVLSEGNLVLGGFANPSGISAADFYAALFLADDAFHDGLLPTYDFADGGVLTPSSYLIAPDITPPVVPEPSTWAMMLIGFADLGFARYRQRRKLSVAASI